MSVKRRGMGPPEFYTASDDEPAMFSAEIVHTHKP